MAFISLCRQGCLPPWLAVTVVAKDVYTVLGTGALYFAGETTVAPPGIRGKLSTLLQIDTAGLALLSASCTVNSDWLNGLFAVSGLATALTLGQYIWRGSEFPHEILPERALFASRN